MTLLAVVNGKGAPGATTVALLLASAWPRERRLVVEADADGGVLAARLGLSYEPGLVSLAGHARRSLTAHDLLEHVQPLPGGLSALVAPGLPDQCAAVLDTIAEPLARQFAQMHDVDVIADLGRARGATRAFIAAADRLLVVSRPRLDELQHAVTHVRSLRDEPCAVELVLIGEGPYSAAQVRDVVQPDAPALTVRTLPLDRRGAQLLNGERVASHWMARRAPLLRAGHDLAVGLADDTATLSGGPASAEPVELSA